MRIKSMRSLTVRALFPMYLMMTLPVTHGADPTLTLVNSGGSSASNVPITFGFVFAPGDVPSSRELEATGEEGTPLPIQTDIKATHPDGSLRHAVITLVADAPQVVNLSPADPQTVTPPPADAFLPPDLTASVELDLGGVVYTANAGETLTAAATSSSQDPWLCGPLVCEWEAEVPFLDGSRRPHPHLILRAALRAYLGGAHYRLDFTVENCRTYVPSPQGYTYDAIVRLNGETVASYSGIEHSHHARWRKTFWSGGEPELMAIPDPEYLSLTGAIPFYDPTIQADESALASLSGSFAPMSLGDFTGYMPTTGAHDDIGPLPRWEALFAVSGDPRALAGVLANGGAAGSYSVHYRDEETGFPVLLDDYPYMTLLGNPGDTWNPNTGKSEAFPDVTDGLEVGTADDAHQPSMGYLAYLLSGDRFHLEEMHFWVNWNLILANPSYRDYAGGLLKWGQVRGQAWTLRSLGQAAYITPDAHPLKVYFTEKLTNNITWYLENVVQNPEANPLGWIGTGYAFAYDAYGIAPWQDDFFTWTMGRLVELGFAEARPIALWKSRFVVGRLADPEYCWLSAPAYSLQVGPADRSSVYASFGELYRANFPGGNCEGLVMEGVPDSPTGYGANMQPALALAVDLGVPGAAEAWVKYETRDPKQEYESSPIWAVVPRNTPIRYLNAERPDHRMKTIKAARSLWSKESPMLLFQRPGTGVWRDVKGRSNGQRTAIRLQKK